MVGIVIGTFGSFCLYCKYVYEWCGMTKSENSCLKHNEAMPNCLFRFIQGDSLVNRDLVYKKEQFLPQLSYPFLHLTFNI